MLSRAAERYPSVFFATSTRRICARPCPRFEATGRNSLPEAFRSAIGRLILAEHTLSAVTAI